ncbi:MAG: DMT family transporter [Betaproteobacteria bacterium]|nr:DMT family transporter [Betaproteobacteria bacterium]
MTRTSSLRGIAAMTAGAGLLTLSDAASKYLTEHYPLGQVLCLRQIAALAFMLPYAWAVTGLGALRAVNHGGQLLRGLLFVFSTGLVLTSLSLLPLSFVTIVLFSSPLFVAMLAAPVLGERVDLHQWIAITIGFAGVLLIVRPAGSGFEWAVLLPLCGAFSNGLRDAVTRRLSRTDSSISVLFWSGVMVMIAGLCTIPYGWEPVDSSGAAWFLAAGLFNAAAHFMVIESFRLGHAAVVSPFRYTGLLWAMLVGFLIWREVPDAWMLTGAAVVACAGVYMLRYGVSKS